MSIVAVGSMAIDSITTPHGEANDVLGGSGTYFSVAASYFSPVKLIGVVGKDFPKKHFRALHKRKINTEGVTIDSGKTFRWTGSYDKTMAEATTLDVSINVLENFKPVIPESYQETNYLFLANIDPTVQRQVLDAVRPQHLVVMDTMNIWIEVKRQELLDVIAQVDVVILNDAEARQLTQESNLVMAARAIANLGPDRVIIKKGEHGAFMLSSEGHFSMPAYLQETLVDTTGAGDSFAGGFLGYVAQSQDRSEKDFRNALVYGNVMASFAVENFSIDGLSRLKKVDIRQRYRDICRLVKI